jgi:hypothetical protein
VVPPSNPESRRGQFLTMSYSTVRSFKVGE